MLRSRVVLLAKKTAATKKAAAVAVGGTFPQQKAPKSDKGQLVDARGIKLAEPPAAKELAAAGKARRAAGKLRFDAYKAGLQKVDKAHVEQVIREASEGSPFYLKEQRKEEARREKIHAMLKKVEDYKALPQSQKNAIKAKVDEMEKKLEATRDVRKVVLHIDDDQFYAAVEEKKNPQLRDVPFGVGSLQMLATTNYIARQYGVRSGMPGFIGKKLCPDLLIVPTDFAAYRREAAVIHSIAARYDPDFVSLGLDELTMDLTNYLKEFPYLTASQVATDFRDEVFAKTQLTCSGGIAPTPVLAKIASNVNKPNGQHEIKLLNREDFIAYMKDMPLGKIPGIGYAQESTLNALGIKHCGDLLKHKYMLAYLFKEKTFEHYLAVGLGLMGTNAHKQHELRQSIGKEVSFSDPLSSPDALMKLFRKLMEPCHAQCVRERLYPKQMKLVLKYRTYDNQQFSTSLPKPTNDLKLWLEAGRKLLEPHLQDYGELRLVGVRVQKFETEESSELGQVNQDDVSNLTGSAKSTPAAAAPMDEQILPGASKGAASTRPTQSIGDDDSSKFDAEDEDEHHRAYDEKIAEDIEEEGGEGMPPPATRAPAAASGAKKAPFSYSAGSQRWSAGHTKPGSKKVKAAAAAKKGMKKR